LRFEGDDDGDGTHNRFEAHMEMHVGSVDEAEHEQGIAHMIEHVAFLGSKKREKLLGTGARSNAYTDFHHTVFHVHSPVTTQVAFLPCPHTHQPGFFFSQM
jgi:predicted Zn-dependent peptidase